MPLTHAQDGPPASVGGHFSLKEGSLALTVLFCLHSCPVCIFLDFKGSFCPNPFCGRLSAGESELVHALHAGIGLPDSLTPREREDWCFVCQACSVSTSPRVRKPRPRGLNHTSETRVRNGGVLSASQVHACKLLRGMGRASDTWARGRNVKMYYPLRRLSNNNLAGGMAKYRLKEWVPSEGTHQPSL